MKTLKMIAVILLFGFIAASCEGPEGPKGNNGTNGIDGVDGTDGTDGNANVACYGFPGTTVGVGATSLSHSLPITTAMVDSSMILPYLQYSGMWYQIGQIGPNGDFLTRYFITGGTTTSTVYSRIHNLDGTTYSGVDYVLDSFRIFVIPANAFHMAEQHNLNFANYNEVSGYFSNK